MNYPNLIQERNEELQERLSLVMERLAQIQEEQQYSPQITAYFHTVSGYLLLQNKVAQMALCGELATMSKEDGKLLNRQLYDCFLAENYDTCFANPTYAVAELGADYGPYLSALFARIQRETPYVFEGNIQYLCIFAELMVELYNCFEDGIKDSIYSFMHDYTEVFHEEQLARLFLPEYDYATGILMDSDLSTQAYLYRYGHYVGNNEIKSAQYLNTFSEAEIQSMADTFTEGYRMGFETMKKDLSIKTTVEIRYPLGFERMVRVAVSNFEKLGLRSVVKPYTTSVNKQFDYDHKEDAALWLDKAYVERGLEVYRSVFEKYKEQAAGYAGPAVIEVFGEEPFSPISKDENVRFSEKQQQIVVYQKREFSQMLNQYIHGEERGFTIIAYPIPDIGKDYEAIFAETVKINTLDYMLYRDMQQKIIDVLDTADKVHILGAKGNRTDLYVQIYPLSNPQTETAFENCVADVNIPVGEVFTSPVLKGTTGKLHVSQVYLNELSYKDLEIDFKDGMISDYSCANFEDASKNRKYIEDNVLMHHKTLPMGEFAIGTNTTAFRMAKVFDIAEKLPILIAEKTGPHFAVGDTCYTYDEDNMTYNPDGKAIVARDNEISIQRKTDVSKAYFNCHTDITIPYDELRQITVIRKDGSTQDIIVNGRFVVPGTEILNVPLEELLIK